MESVGVVWIDWLGCIVLTGVSDDSISGFGIQRFEMLGRRGLQVLCWESLSSSEIGGCLIVSMIARYPPGQVERTPLTEPGIMI